MTQRGMKLMGRALWVVAAIYLFWFAGAVVTMLYAAPIYYPVGISALLFYGLGTIGISAMAYLASSAAKSPPQSSK